MSVASLAVDQHHVAGQSIDVAWTHGRVLHLQVKPLTEGGVQFQRDSETHGQSNALRSGATMFNSHSTGRNCSLLP
jgi:hypothetical protein